MWLLEVGTVLAQTKQIVSKTEEDLAIGYISTSLRTHFSFLRKPRCVTVVSEIKLKDLSFIHPSISSFAIICLTNNYTKISGEITA